MVKEQRLGEIQKNTSVSIDTGKSTTTVGGHLQKATFTRASIRMDSGMDMER